MSPNSPSNARSTRSLWVPVVLFAFAAVLLFDPFSFTPPDYASTDVPAWVTDTTPVRQPKENPEYKQAVFTYRCSDCHKIIPSPLETQRTLTQHSEIQLKHGMNTRCFNCHHRTNRDAFADDLGGEIPWDQPELVCAKCHGPVYRDWQNGAHGRTNGYWLESAGTQTRKKCVECHDPHQPPFPSMHPAPAPNTLRMGRQDFDRHAEHHNPLQLSRFAETHDADGQPDSAHTGAEEGR